MGYNVGANLSVREQADIDEVMGKVWSERIRQRKLLDAGEVPIDLYQPDYLTPDVSPQNKLVLLTEELGEVAKAIRARYFVAGLLDSQKIFLRENIETELVHLATHAVTWRAALV